MKKFLVGVVAAAAMVFPMSAGATSYPLGDLNCSGSVTSVDISIMTHVVAGGQRPAGCDTPADLNCSGAPSSADIAIIIHLAAGGTYDRPC